MGQVLSNIWNFVRDKFDQLIHPNPNPSPNPNPIELKQKSHCINIPHDHYSSSKPVRIIDFTHQVQVPSVVVEKRAGSRNEEEKEIVVKKNKNVIKRIGRYTSTQKIVVLGDGDFSFSASLAVALGSASNITATSLNSQDFLVRNYRKFSSNKELVSRGGIVMHEVNATTMVKHHILGCFKFDRIVFNFPHAGVFGPTDAELCKHKKLVEGFLRNTKQMINVDGEIHVTHKTSHLFRRWNIPKIGSDQGLILNQQVEFELSEYPGYHTKYGFGGDRDFHCVPSKTYIFRLLPN